MAALTELKMNIKPIQIQKNDNFFEGPGSWAWLNFTLDIKDVLRSMDL